MAFSYASHTVDWGSESSHSLMALLSLFLNSYAALPRYTRGGIQLSAGVLPYLITHYRRDMSSLTAMLDQLDHYSLVTKRPITLPLLRELMLQQQP